MQIKNFSIFKNKDKKKDNDPDYTISINTGTKEQPSYNTCGACWLKDGNDGSKYISCKLSDAYGEKRGWHIEVDEPTEAKGKSDGIDF
jgi:uncharacterized protein (DUF736 family)